MEVEAADEENAIIIARAGISDMTLDTFYVTESLLDEDEEEDDG